MKTLNIIWNFLAGKKAIICFVISTMISSAVEEGLIAKTKWILWIIRVIIVLGGLSIYDHHRSGRFKQVINK